MEIDSDVIIEEFDDSPKAEFNARDFLRGAVDKGRANDAARKSKPVDETPHPAADSKPEDPEAAKAPSSDTATQDPEPGSDAPTSDPGPDAEKATQRTDEGDKSQQAVDYEARFKASSTEAKRLAHVARETQQRLAEVSGQLEQLQAQQKPISFDELSPERQRYYEWQAERTGKHPEVIYEAEQQLQTQEHSRESQMLARMHEEAASRIAQHLDSIPDDFREKIVAGLADHPELSSALDKMHPEAALEFGRHYLDQAHELEKLRADNEKLKAEQKALTEAAYGDGIKDARQNITRKRRAGTEAGRDQTVDTDFSKAEGLKPKSQLDSLIADKDRIGDYVWVD